MRSSEKAFLNLSLVLSGSRLEQWFLLSCHGAGITALWLSGLPVWLAVAATLGLGATMLMSWRLSSHPGLSQILYRQETWTLVGPKRQVWKGRLLPSTRAGRWVTLLHFRLDNGRFMAIPVWRDSLCHEDYRHLQVVLRWVVKV